MSVAGLRDRLKALAGQPATPAVLCITGASGAGKTHSVATLRERIEPRLMPTLEFDSLGVPTPEAMTAGWESPRGWQKAMTWHWVYTARHVYRTHPLVVLEGSFDPQYAIAASSAHRVKSTVVLLDADDAVRGKRLAQRGQAELATDDMNKWATYLRESAQQLGGVIVDASRSIDEVIAALCAHAIQLIDANAEAPVRERRTRPTTRRTN